MKTIDVTPTWGEVGRIFGLLIQGKEWKALQHAKPEIARACAAAQALQALQPTLTDAQQSIVARVLADELTKQGY